MFIVYDPTTFKMSGPQIIQVLKEIQPGDVILRKFDSYADSKFIPGEYSHGAIYVGDHKIIHAVAEGVQEIDVIDFCMCDKICILRPKAGIENAISKAKKFLEEDTPYDFAYRRGSSALYCFELCAECYPELQIKTHDVKKLFGLLKKRNVYLAKSFTESPDFKIVFQSSESSRARSVKRMKTDASS